MYSRPYDYVTTTKTGYLIISSVRHPHHPLRFGQMILYFYLRSILYSIHPNECLSRFVCSQLHYLNFEQ